MLIPTKIKFPGEDSCRINERTDLRQVHALGWTYHANMRSEYRRESIEDTYSWIKPLGPSIIDTLRLIWPMDLLLKKGYNVGGRVAGLELGGEWMGQQILPRAFLVHFQRVIDN